MRPQVVAGADKDQVARALAERTLAVLRDAQQLRGRAGIALTGGSMGIASITAITRLGLENPELAPDWSQLDVWWSDERFLPAGHDERNAAQAAQALQEAGLELPIPDSQIHPMGASGDFATPEDAASDYRSELRTAAGRDAEGGEFPIIDIALLGLGPDGHVASVFPGREETGIAEADVIAVHDSPKPPPERVSMTLPLISQAHHVWYVVAGAEKAEAVARLLAGTSARETPACGVSGRRSTVLFAAQDALEHGQD